MSQTTLPSSTPVTMSETAESSTITVYLSDDTNYIRWDSKESQGHTTEPFVAASAGWGFVDWWPRRQTAAEKTLQKLNQQIREESVYLPYKYTVCFEADDYRYSDGTLPIRLLIGTIAPEFSYSFRNGSEVWATLQDSSHTNPGIKLLSRLVDGTLVELPCSSWTAIKKILRFDSTNEAHLLKPTGINELIMQIQYCFLVAAAGGLHGFDGQGLPINPQIADVLKAVAYRTAVEDLFLGEDKITSYDIAGVLESGSLHERS
ncbi:hypothetical protein OPT61_g8260 [Boeremia exigua]|uniref:Uncharacterized protein n=1 Tax=Boeremia exigua TaxID=749465 RepID=A0ACC2I039_9PLEO|nr:hypothetical protein OPT61_g8260 [Boeremia exigua]